MKKSIPELPKLPIIVEPHVHTRVVFANTDKTIIIATRNFSDNRPVWKKYKKMGWAIKYANG